MNTKQKGTVTEAKIKADLLSKGYGVAVLEGDYLPFDIVVISPKLNMYKVQIKHARTKNGSIVFGLRKTVFKNGKYSNNKRYDLTEVDIFAIYSEEFDECFYIKHKEIVNIKTEVFLRVLEPKDFIRNTMRFAKDYKKFPLP